MGIATGACATSWMVSSLNVVEEETSSTVSDEGPQDKDPGFKHVSTLRRSEQQQRTFTWMKSSILKPLHHGGHLPTSPMTSGWKMKIYLYEFM